LQRCQNTFSDGVGAFDVQTQKLIWQQEGSFTTQSNPLNIYEDYLFVPVDNDIPLALHLQTGDIIWKASGLSNDVYSAAHIIDDVVYVKALLKRKLYAVEHTLMRSADSARALTLEITRLRASDARPNHPSLGQRVTVVKTGVSSGVESQRAALPAFPTPPPQTHRARFRSSKLSSLDILLPD